MGRMGSTPIFPVIIATLINLDGDGVGDAQGIGVKLNFFRQANCVFSDYFATIFLTLWGSEIVSSIYLL